MKKLYLSLLLVLSGCAGSGYQFVEDHGVNCYQTEAQEDTGEKTCLRVPTYTDETKWHRVKAWQELPSIPDLP